MKYDTIDVNQHDLEPYPWVEGVSIDVLNQALKSYEKINMSQAHLHHAMLRSSGITYLPHVEPTSTDPTITPTHKVPVGPTAGIGRASVRAADRAIKKQALATLVQDYELNFVYFRMYRETELGWEVDPNGGMVLAYRISLKGGSVIDLATSLCSPQDGFDKLEGKFRAANNFAQGKFIQLKLPRAGEYSKQLRQMYVNMHEEMV